MPRPIPRKIASVPKRERSRRSPAGEEIRDGDIDEQEPAVRAEPHRFRQDGIPARICDFRLPRLDRATPRGRAPAGSALRSGYARPVHAGREDLPSRHVRPEDARSPSSASIRMGRSPRNRYCRPNEPSARGISSQRPVHDVGPQAPPTTCGRSPRRPSWRTIPRTVAPSPRKGNPRPPRPFPFAAAGGRSSPPVSAIRSPSCRPNPPCAHLSLRTPAYAHRAVFDPVVAPSRRRPGPALTPDGRSPLVTRREPALRGSAANLVALAFAPRRDASGGPLLPPTARRSFRRRRNGVALPRETRRRPTWHRSRGATFPIASTRRVTPGDRKIRRRAGAAYSS